ncbi:glycosyltransferase family A protein [Desulfococcaceae bacterium HSG9]|nr:glycosyltransferase family A protein [Desulfococcaceae bacterium HSG9]
MEAGLVSTIIPVFNRALLLTEAVNSVLAQTYRPIEIIIVDDGSTDNTKQVANKLATEHPNEIKVIFQNNTGPGLAREAGRLSAQGEFIQYLDSDDLLLPQKFELQVRGLRNNPKCSVSYGKTRYCEKDSVRKDTPWKRTGEKIETMFPSFLQSRWWGTSTPLYKKRLIDKVGPWIGLNNEEDWEYDCRVAAQGIALHYVSVFISEERDIAKERLSQYCSTDQAKLQHRTIAHALIFNHAKKYGITTSCKEMRHFARELFLLSRQCGAAKLKKEAEELFELARMASEVQRRNQWDFKIYKCVSKLIGWPLTGKIASYGWRFTKKIGLTKESVIL